MKPNVCQLLVCVTKTEGIPVICYLEFDVVNPLKGVDESETLCVVI